MNLSPLLVRKNDFIGTYKLKKFGLSYLKHSNLRLPLYGNENLAKIVSYITFDGHLSLTKNIFYLSAGKPIDLREFKKLIKKEFGINGNLIKSKTSLGNSYKYQICNKPLCRILHLIGVPSGAKVILPFLVPKWIIENRKFSKTYLQTAFDCEGSIWKEGKNRVKIRFKINKSKDMIDNGIKLLKTMKKKLLTFGIGTSKIWLVNSNKRKDGKITKSLSFNILASSIPIFAKEIGFKIKHKKELLIGSKTGP